MKSFYINDISKNNNYGIYESLINTNVDETLEGIFNKKEYYYKYNTKSLFNRGSKKRINYYDFKFSIEKNQMNIIPKESDVEVNKFNMKVIIDMLNEVYSYNKEMNNEMYVFVPGNFFIDERNRYTNDIEDLLSECQNKYNRMIELNEETI